MLDSIQSHSGPRDRPVDSVNGQSLGAGQDIALTQPQSSGHIACDMAYTL